MDHYANSNAMSNMNIPAYTGGASANEGTHYTAGVNQAPMFNSPATISGANMPVYPTCGQNSPLFVLVLFILLVIILRGFWV